MKTLQHNISTRRPCFRVSGGSSLLISKRLLSLLQINCVTFPLPGEGPEQQLLKPNEWSYCDYFWVSSAQTQDPQYERLTDSSSILYIVL